MRRVRARWTGVTDAARRSTVGTTQCPQAAWTDWVAVIVFDDQFAAVMSSAVVRKQMCTTDRALALAEVCGLQADRHCRLARKVPPPLRSGEHRGQAHAAGGPQENTRRCHQPLQPNVCRSVQKGHRTSANLLVAFWFARLRAADMLRTHHPNLAVSMTRLMWANSCG